MRSIKYLNQPIVNNRPKRSKPDMTIKRETLKWLELMFKKMPRLHQLTILILAIVLIGCEKEPVKHKFECINTVITQKIGYIPDTTYIHVRPTKLMTNDEIISFMAMNSNLQYITINNIPVIAVDSKMECKLNDCFNSNKK